MHTPAANSHRTIVDETYFERKARELVVPDDEIEAWELDDQDLEGLGGAGQRYGSVDPD